MSVVTSRPRMQIQQDKFILFDSTGAVQQLTTEVSTMRERFRSTIAPGMVFIETGHTYVRVSLAVAVDIKHHSTYTGAPGITSVRLTELMFYVDEASVRVITHVV